VAEVGCGPGRITAYLRGLGLDVFGVDVSAVMIELASSEYPGLWFEVGSMGALKVADAELACIVSWYSVIHAAPEELPAYFDGLRPQGGARVPMAHRLPRRASGRGAVR
jgi:trans-aconitate methyltransferase